MPSHDLFLYFQDSLTIQGHWAVNGRHYGMTADAWLRKHDANPELVSLFETPAMYQRWRVFHLAVRECFNYNGGNEWMVSHFLFKKS